MTNKVYFMAALFVISFVGVWFAAPTEHPARVVAGAKHSGRSQPFKYLCHISSQLREQCSRCGKPSEQLCTGLEAHQRHDHEPHGGHPHVWPL